MSSLCLAFQALSRSCSILLLVIVYGWTIKQLSALQLRVRERGKTRHLLVRAYALREAVRLEELRINHVEGLRQLGDLGTKCFHRPRLEQLKELWGLRGGCEVPEGTGCDDPSGPGSGTIAPTTVVNGVACVLARLTVVFGWLIQEICELLRKGQMRVWR